MRRRRRGPSLRRLWSLALRATWKVLAGAVAEFAADDSAEARRRSEGSRKAWITRKARAELADHRRQQDEQIALEEPRV